MLIVNFIKLKHGLDLPDPSYATSGSAGIDLYAAIDQPVCISPNERKLLSTGIALHLPPSYEAQIRPRSGLAIKYGITVLNTPGTIDSDYRGEIKVILVNLSKDEFTINRGMRIAQMVINEVKQVQLTQVEKLEDTVRGNGGFGSTGLK